jgi:hypothetical protein
MIFKTSLSEIIVEFNTNADFGFCSFSKISVEILPVFFSEDKTVSDAKTKGDSIKKKDVAK